MSAVMTSAAALPGIAVLAPPRVQTATTEPRAVRWLLCALAFAFLALFLFVPLAAVFADTFGVSTLGLPTIAAVRRKGGLAIDTNRRALGLTLGFSEDAMLSRVRADESIIRRLVLTPDDPSAIEFDQIPEPSCD